MTVNLKVVIVCFIIAMIGAIFNAGILNDASTIQKTVFAITIFAIWVMGMGFGLSSKKDEE